MKNHFHILIWAATDKVGDGYSGVTYLDLIVNSAEEIENAIERAKKICPDRRYYWVNNIIEHHPHEYDHAEHTS